MSFIFFTAFAFLNMVIGIVVNVMEEEHSKEAKKHSTEPSMQDLQDEIAELKQLIGQLADQRNQK